MRSLLYDNCKKIYDKILTFYERWTYGVTMSASPSGSLGENAVGGGSTLKPYLKRKKSSLGETKIAVLGAEGVGKSGKKTKCSLFLLK